MVDLRVGLIGVNATRGWAAEAHVPAIRAVPGLELTAVATRKQASADAAAAAFGVPKAYGDPDALIDDPEVDVVAVASSVATHHRLISRAVRAGKHVLTEWPLAVGTGAMAALADQARTAGMHTALGLQARRNPAVLRAQAVIAQGEIGRLLVARVFSSTMAFGAAVDDETLPLEDPAAGMHLLTIQAAHTLDLLAVIAGTPVQLAATTTIRFPELRRADGDGVRRVLPDHVLAQGTLPDGGAFTAEIEGGRDAGDTPFRLEVEGSDGTVRLEGGAPRGFQSGTLELTVDGATIPVETGMVPASVVNVAGVYRALRDDVCDGTVTAPSFADGVRLAHLLDDVRRSAVTGSTVTPTAPWPKGSDLVTP
jgi:predicted dehydrogenase